MHIPLLHIRRNVEAEQERQRYIEIGHSVELFEDTLEELEHKNGRRYVYANSGNPVPWGTDKAYEGLGRIGAEKLVKYNRIDQSGIPVKKLNPP